MLLKTELQELVWEVGQGKQQKQQMVLDLDSTIMNLSAQGELQWELSIRINP